MSDLSPRRKRVITIALAAFLLAHAFVLVVGDQHWPVMSFPMLSFNFDDELKCTVAFGVPEDPAKPEFRLMPNQVGVAGQTLSYVFAKIMKYPERNPAFDQLAAACPPGDDAGRGCARAHLADGGLEFLYKRYEAQRKKHPDKLPPLRAMRLYDMRFTPSPHVYDVAGKQLRHEWSPR